MKVKDTMNVENEFLNEIRKQTQNVQIYLIGGISLVGTIKRFDDYTIILSSKFHEPQLIYKHSITTISPYNGEKK
jgi:host factor-I protein